MGSLVTIQTIHGKVKKDQKTKLKKSTVNSSSPMKLRRPRSSKITKTTSKRKSSNKIVGQEKHICMENQLEKTEESESTLTKGTKIINRDIETAVKLRRSKRTRK